MEYPLRMIPRTAHLNALRAALRRTPIASILGPRQSGKTTLARMVTRTARAARAHVFDLEDPVDVARLASPLTALQDLRGLVVIDEIQRMPALFPILRVLADRPRTPARFLLLGSASLDLVRGVSETLAGRVSHVALPGFDLSEVGPARFGRLWLRGSLPRAFLAATDPDSLAWRRDYVRDFLERDIPQLGISIPAAALGRFWNMVAHFHGGIWNAAELARSIGASDGTARRYLDLLTGAFVVRQLQPWFENLSKRQVKAPKIYVRDSGLLHALLSVETRAQLLGHYKYGASWEGFAIEQVLSILGIDQGFFWATHQGAELDLLVVRGGRRFGFEMKCSDAPHLTKSMAVALHDLRLAQLFVVYPGRTSYALSSDVQVVSILELPERLASLK